MSGSVGLKWRACGAMYAVFAFLITDDIFCAEAVVVCQGYEAEVHVRRFFVHMDYGGDYGFFWLVCLNEVECVGEIGFDFRFLFILEKTPDLR